MPLDPSKTHSRALDPCQRRVIPGMPPDRVSVRSRTLSRAIRLGWRIVQRADDCLMPIYRKLSKSRMRLDTSRSPPSALTPATSRVIPESARIAGGGHLDPSSAMSGGHPADCRGRDSEILDHSSISSGAGIVADCNDYERQSLPLEIMAARNSSMSNILTGKILDERLIALRSEAQFPPYAHGRMRARFFF